MRQQLAFLKLVTIQFTILQLYSYFAKHAELKNICRFNISVCQFISHQVFQSFGCLGQNWCIWSEINCSLSTRAKRRPRIHKRDHDFLAFNNGKYGRDNCSFCLILTIGGMTPTVWQDKIIDFTAEQSYQMNHMVNRLDNE